jgi:hypothetical protein
MSAVTENVFRDPGFESGALFRVNTVRVIESGVADSSAVVSDDKDELDPNFGPVLVGSRSLRVSCSANSNSTPIALALVELGWYIDAEEDQVWSAGCLVGFVGDGLTGRIGISFVDAAKVPLTDGGFDESAEGEEEIRTLRVEGAIAPPGTAYVLLKLSVVMQQALATGAAYFDEVVIGLGDAVSVPIDGFLRGYEWTGARFGSSSAILQDPDNLEEMHSWVPEFLWSRPSPPPESP